MLKKLCLALIGILTCSNYCDAAVLSGVLKDGSSSGISGFYFGTTPAFVASVGIGGTSNVPAAAGASYTDGTNSYSTSVLSGFLSSTSIKVEIAHSFTPGVGGLVTDVADRAITSGSLELKSDVDAMFNGITLGPWFDLDLSSGFGRHDFSTGFMKGGIAYVVNFNFETLLSVLNPMNLSASTSFNVSVTSLPAPPPPPPAVPEPASMAIFGLVGTGVFFARRRMRKSQA